MLHLRHYAIAFIFAALFCSPAEARHYRHGRCDGFHACRCGTTAAREAGLPYVFHGVNLKQARAWLAFKRASIGPGMVGYVRRGGPTGHVFTVKSYDGGDTAIVKDDAGTYERSIRNATFVEPGVLRGG
jgi:hypothetical protein